jgi:hypothetical protein
MPEVPIPADRPFIHRIYRPLLTFFRKKRVRAFFQMNHIGPESRILDVGGSMLFWKLALQEGLPAPHHIVILNMHKPEEPLPPNVSWIIADARRIPMANNEFDIVFSNSVIEHLGDLESQRAMALEVRRAGRSHWVQTPDPRFPIEPHYLTPIVHWIPIDQRGRFLRNGTVWGLITRPTGAQIASRLKEIRLIRESEFRLMFPESKIVVERFFGWPKALIAAREADD